MRRRILVGISAVAVLLAGQQSAASAAGSDSSRLAETAIRTEAVSRAAELSIRSLRWTEQDRDRSDIRRAVDDAIKRSKAHEAAAERHQSSKSRIAVAMDIPTGTASISGTVKDETGVPVGGIFVAAEFEVPGEGFFALGDVTDATGSYVIPNLPAGMPKLMVDPTSPSSSPAYLNEYAIGYHPDTRRYRDAVPVPLGAGEAKTGYDFIARPGGAINGVVTAASAPLPGAFVCPLDPDRYGRCAQTSADGSYIAGGLADEFAYSLLFTAPSYVSEFWDDQPGPETAAPVSVTPGGSGGPYNADLAPGASITGTVTSAADGQPVEGALVCAFDVTGRCSQTDAAGVYIVDGLSAGSYLVEFRSPSVGLASEYWQDATSSVDATRVLAAAGSAVNGINAALEPGGAITGTVTDGSAPVGGVSACAIAAGTGGSRVSCGVTNADGTYSILGLLPGDHIVSFLAYGRDLAVEYYPNSRSYAGAVAVAATVGQATPGIDAALEPGGTISGTVTSDVTQQPLPGSYVCPRMGGFDGCVLVGPDGTYRASNLPTVPGVVQFFGPDPSWASEYWNDATVEANATVITPSGGPGVTGIDAALAAAPVDPAPVLTGLSRTDGSSEGGTSVTLTGTGLGGVTSVTFDGVEAASFTIRSATRIVAVTPPGAVGAADVAVQAPSGIGTLADAFVYVGPPQVTEGLSVVAIGSTVTVSWTRLAGTAAGGLPVTYTAKLYTSSIGTKSAKSCTVRAADTASACSMSRLKAGSYWAEVVATNTEGSSVTARMGPVSVP